MNKMKKISVQVKYHISSNKCHGAYQRLALIRGRYLFRGWSFFISNMGNDIAKVSTLSETKQKTKII